MYYQKLIFVVLLYLWTHWGNFNTFDCKYILQSKLYKYILKIQKCIYKQHNKEIWCKDMKPEIFWTRLQCHKAHYTLHTLCKVKKVKIQHKKHTYDVLNMFICFFGFYFEIFPSILIKDENNQTLRSQFDNNNQHYICILMSFLPCQQER